MRALLHHKKNDKQVLWRNKAVSSKALQIHQERENTELTPGMLLCATVLVLFWFFFSES